MNKTKYISYKNMVSLCQCSLEKAGIKKNHAFITSEAICSASLRGTDSHGVRLLPHYIQAIKARRIDPKADFKFNKISASTESLDAKHGIAHAAVAEAMDHAIKLAEKSGVGFVSVKNSNHCGAMAYYSLRASKKDMIGLASTNATAKLQTFNSTKPFFGLNPLCFTAPMNGEEPFCYDGSPSVMSNNKVKLIIEQGGKLPSGVAADKNGKETTDPKLAKMLKPIGGEIAGYKGYGLSMIVDILCSLLSGMPNATNITKMYEQDGGNISDKRYLGQFVGALRIDAFTDLNNFKKRLKQSADEVRNLPKEKNAKNDVMIPGDPEKKEKRKRMNKGIPIDEKLYNFLIAKKDEC